jgi:hypothetical protein
MSSASYMPAMDIYMVGLVLLMEVTVHDRGGEYFSQDGEAQEEGMLSSS